LDLGQLYTIKGLSLKLGTSYNDYPRGYKVEVSSNGVEYVTVKEEQKTQMPATAFMYPKQMNLYLMFKPTDARHIRITQTGEDNVFYWSIHEIDVFEEKAE